MPLVERWFGNRARLACALFTTALSVNACAPKFNFRSSLNLSAENQCVASSYQLAFATQPSSSITAGEALPTGGVIEVQDNCGNLITTGSLASATISLSDASGNGNIAGVTSVTASGGIATIPNNTLTFEKAGTTNLGASAAVGGYGTLIGTSNSIAIATPSFSEIEALSGPDDPNGDVDGNGTSARLWMPSGITTDGTYVYIWEYDPSCVVRRYNLSSGAVDTWIGKLYDCGSRDGAIGTNKLESQVNGALATDDTNLYFEDYDKIRAADLSTGTTTTIAGTGTAGDSDNAIGTDATMGGLGGLFVYGTKLYFGDNGNCQIRYVDLSNPDYPVTTMAGDGTCGQVDNSSPLSAEVGAVRAFAADATYLYFGDNNDVRTYNWSTHAITTVADVGEGVNGLAVVGSTIYALAGTSIFAATIGTWTFSIAAGSDSDSPGEVDGDSSSSLLAGGQSFDGWLGYQSMLTSGGLVYFSDGPNGTLRTYDPGSTDVTTIAGTPNAGQGLTWNTTGAEARYQSLEGVVSDGTSLFAWDGYETNVFHVISMADGSTGSAEGSGSGLQTNNYGQQPMAMIGSTLYFASSKHCEILAINPYTWTKSVLAGGTCGEAEGSFSTAKFTGIGGITSDNQNHLYVFDNNSIKVLDLEAETVSVLSGTPGGTGCATGTASASRFDEGEEYLTYLNGKIYFAASGCFGSGVVEVDASTGASTVYAGNGTQGYVDGSIANAKFGFDGYWGIPITNDGQNLYLFDSSNAVVREIDIATGTVSTLFGSSTQQYQTDGSLATAGAGTQSAEPQYGLYYGYGKLYLVDERGVRVVQ